MAIRCPAGCKGKGFLLAIAVLVLLAIGSSSGQTRLDQTVSRSGTQAVPATAAMSFSEVVKYALQHNAGIAAGREGIDVARAGRNAAQAQRYPVVGAGSSLVANSVAQPPLFFFRGSGVSSSMGMGIFTTPFLATSYLTYAGTLSLPLYTGGRISSQIRIGDVATQIAELQLKQTQDDLILNLASAYYGIQRFQRVIEARQRNVDALKENERIVSQLVDVGRAPKVDLLRVQARLANVRQQLIEAQNMLDVAYYVLNSLMGITDISFRVVPTEKLEAAPPSVNLPSLIKEALHKRPIVLEREQEVHLGDAQVSFARSQLRPLIGLQGLWYGGGTSLSHGLTQGIVQPVGTRQQNDWGGQIFISVPIFDRSLKQQEREAAFDLARRQSGLTATRLSVQREVETAYADLNSAANRVDAAKTALASAQESLRIENLLVNVGRGVVSDLLLAQADSLLAEENYIGALADYKVAEVAMQRAIGQITVP